MTYVAGNPLTGFTLEIDGEIEVIDRIARAVTRALGEELARARREQESLWSLRADTPPRFVYPIMPFTGTIQLRTVEIAE